MLFSPSQGRQSLPCRKVEREADVIAIGTIGKPFDAAGENWFRIDINRLLYGRLTEKPSTDLPACCCKLGLAEPDRHREGSKILIYSRGSADKGFVVTMLRVLKPEEADDGPAEPRPASWSHDRCIRPTHPKKEPTRQHACWRVGTRRCRLADRNRSDRADPGVKPLIVPAPVDFRAPPAPVDILYRMLGMLLAHAAMSSVLRRMKARRRFSCCPRTKASLHLSR